MNALRLALAACLGAGLATCAHPAPPAVSPPAWKAPVCARHPTETAGPPTGVTVTCQGSSAVSYEELRDAAVFEAAKATLEARRTHLVVEREERNAGPPSVQCPAPDPNENLRTRLAYMTGGSVPTSASQTPCKPISGSEGRDLAVVVRFLRNAAEAATVPGTRSAAEVLGMLPAAPPPPAPAPPQVPPSVDGGSDGAPPRD